jgi:glycosidase
MSRRGPLKSIYDPEVQATLNLTKADKDFFKSPTTWSDEVLYFLLPDRFSDNNEQHFRDLNNKMVITGKTPLCHEAERETAMVDEKAWMKWRNAGSTWVGGNLKGITSKLGYLKRLGVTALWIAPLLKQVRDQPTYHGYSVQNFLEIDPRFGTTKDFKAMVRAAHREGIRVILDVLINHCGDVFSYEENAPKYDEGKKYPVKGFWNDKRDGGFIPVGPIDEKKYPTAYPEGAVWPKELQNEECFVREGEIVDWESSPDYLDGDFFNLKKLNLGSTTAGPDEFVPGPALETLTDVWKYWIASADLDGFRIDAGKHLGKGPLTYFVSEIRQFAKQLGKENFLMVGEIAGPDAMEIVKDTGLSGAIGIGGPQECLWSIPQGLKSPMDYFGAFSNTRGEDAWYRDEIITLIDDHDQIWKNGLKARFGSRPDAETLMPAAFGLNLCTAGIPCIYYGTEQLLDGASEQPPFPADAYIRESMFGGPFGPFRTTDRHVFDETARGYKVAGDIARLRHREPALRRGEQWLRDISTDGKTFGVPKLEMPAFLNTMEDTTGMEVGPPLRTVIAWSRIHEGVELLCAINTDPEAYAEAWSIIDYGIHHEGQVKNCIYPAGQGSVRAQRMEGATVIHLRIPPGGFVVYK